MLFCQTTVYFLCTTVNLWSVFRAFLSEYCPFYRYHFNPGSETAEEKSGQQPLGVPRTHRRPNLPRQRAPYAPPDAEAGGVAQSSIPRPPAHVRYAGTSEWSGHQDGVRDAGTLLNRLHPGHLRTRHHGGPEGSGQDHGEGSDGGAVNS